MDINRLHESSICVSVSANQSVIHRSLEQLDFRLDSLQQFISIYTAPNKCVNNMFLAFLNPLSVLQTRYFALIISCRLDGITVAQLTIKTTETFRRLECLWNEDRKW
jgi:hypothetical protein